MKKRKGLTLIEVVISIAIISIMAVTILGIFNISITNIFKSGHRTEDVLKVKEIIDDEINNNENKTDGTDKITITIDGIESHEIKGTFINKNSKDFNFNIETFVPNKSKSD